MIPSNIHTKAGNIYSLVLFYEPSSISSLLLQQLPAYATIWLLAFILIWVAVPLGFAFVASLLTKALDAVHLGWLNRWLGSGLGALKYMILIGLVIHVIEYIDPNNELISATKKKESVLYYPMRDLSGIFFPVFKNVTEQLIEI